MRKFIAGLGFFLAAALASATGTTYYVSTTGNPAATGLTPAAAWTSACATTQTCGLGGNQPAAGSRVEYLAGTYTGAHGVAGQPVFPITAQGSNTAQIQYVPSYGNHVFLDCQTEVNYVVPGPCVGFKGAVKYVTWGPGFEVAPATAGPNGAEAPRRVSTLPGTFSNQNYGDGIEFMEDGIDKVGIQILGNYIHDTFSGIYGAHEAINPIVEDNIILNVGNDGPRGYLHDVPVTGSSSGCTNYSPLTDTGNDDENGHRIKYPTGTVSGTGGTPATFYVGFDNGFPVWFYVSVGGSPTGTLTCTMPTVPGGSGATCDAIRDPVTHAILEVHGVAPGNGGYLSTQVSGTGTFGHGTFLEITGGALTYVGTHQPGAGVGDDGNGKNYCQDPLGACVALPPVVTMVGNCSGATLGTPTITVQNRGHGHGIYFKNDRGTKWVRNNIILNSHQYGIQIFVGEPGPNQSIRGFYLENNILAAKDGMAAGAPITVGGDPTQRIDLINLITYGVGTAYGGATGANKFASVSIGTSVWRGGMQFSRADWAAIAPNVGAQLIGFPYTKIGGTSAADKILFVGPVYPDPDFKSAFPNNTYYDGEPSSYPPTNPLPWVFKSRVQKGLAHVAILNIEHLAAVNVDISSVVGTGQTYDIRAAEDPLNAIVTAVCNPCTSVAFPMTGTRVAPPIGATKIPLTTHPEFGSFIVNVASLTGYIAGVAPQCPAVTVSPTTLPDGVVGTSYNQTVTASGATSPYTFAPSGGTLPTGLSLSSGGVLSGTPSVSGVFNFIVTATDAAQCTGVRSYAVNILSGACPTITVSPTSLPAGTVSSSYSQTITASGGTSPYTFSVSSGNIPTGLTLTSGGVLSGTPTAAGTYNFTAMATDAASCTGNRSYSIVISPPVSGSPLAGRTLVISNSNVAASGAVANYYATARGIPSLNKFAYAFPNDSVISAAQYATFRTALQTYLTSNSLKDTILYIVFAYRSPYWVTGSGVFGPGLPSLEATGLDSFVSDLFGEASVWITNSKVNPYSNGVVQLKGGIVIEANPPQAFQTLAAYRDGAGQHVYSVWRLDAPTQAQAQAQVDDAIFAEQNGLHGKFYFDSCGAQGGTRCGYNPGGFWITVADMEYNAYQISAASPKIGAARSVADWQTGDASPNPDGIFLYGDGYRDTITWNRGSFGHSWRSAPLLGYSDATGGPRASLAFALLNDPQGWGIAAINRGIAMTAGAIDEPTAQGIPAMDAAWRALVENGANMGDAWFRATKVINWQNFNIGDPLYVPFP